MPSSSAPVVEVEGLHKRYGDVVAVDDVSFDVRAGEIFGILGPNGAGKTTTVECIGGLRQPDRGTVKVFGRDPRNGAGELRQRLGMQLQQSRLPEKIRVQEALDLYASFYRSPADPAELMDTLGLTSKRRTPFEKLSGGQQQRLSIALALVGNPEIAILDELTTGLDPAARRETWRLVETVRARGVAVVLVTHFMEEAERLCDRLAVVDAGRIVALDTPAGIVQAAAGGEQRIRFRVSSDLDLRAVRAVPEVTTATREASEVMITGTGNLLYAISALLVREDVVPYDLRMDFITLDDAFLALTGRSVDQPELLEMR